MHTRISIITTTYKHEKFIAHTIESVLAQTLIDWELLIGDDSPDDATWNIIEDYIQRYPGKIRAWHHSPNKGIVDNTNFLLSHISKDSKFVTFLEGDDMYTKDNLEKKCAIFERYADVQLVYSDLSFINSKNEVILESFFWYRKIPYFQDRKIPRDEFILLPAGPIASWSTGMVRREMIDKFPPLARWKDPKYSISDYEFYYTIATQYSVYGIEEPLTLYRRHGWNLSGASGGTSGDLERWIDMRYDTGNISSILYRKKKSWLSIANAIFALEHGKKAQAWKYLRDALRYDLWYGIIYKLGICGLVVLPTWISQKMLRRLIRRGN